MDEELLRDFLAELDERAEALFADIRELRARAGEGRARRELLSRVFRHVHTVKGTAGAAGLTSADWLAHELETLLEAVGAGVVALEGEVFDALEDAVGALSEEFSAASRGEPSANHAHLVERLRKLSAAHKVARGGASALLPEEISSVLGEHERRQLEEALREGARLFIVSADFDLNDFDERVRSLTNSLAACGEVISTIPRILPGDAARVGFEIVYATTESAEPISERAAAFGATLRLLSVETRSSETDEDKGQAAVEGRSAESTYGGADAETQPLSSLTMLVRVPLEELDYLIAAAYELSGDTSEALERALAEVQSDDSRASLADESARLRRRFAELEEGLIGMRTVPAGPTLERAARVGASAARAAGREVELEVRGRDVSIDKSLAEAVAGPLLHLVRNAVDHGIEPSAERLAAGKSARGRVLVQALAEEGLVLLRVEDDGRGIDVVRVERAARAAGLIGPAEQLNEQQALRLIFRPGFSTATGVSSVSGRGVGLDVVERAVEDAGGEVRVWSRAGRGTTFEMRLPTKLALVPSLVVTAGGQRYCVASAHVEDERAFDASDVEEDEGGAWLVRVGGEAMPLVTLGSLLGRPVETVSREDGRLVVSRTPAREGVRGATRVAVAVDGVEDRREVLVRGLGRHGGRWRGVTGAAELRGRGVALVLDLPRLLDFYL